MAITKHIGRHKGTGQRLSVVFMQIPEDKEHALVVYSDMLQDKFHDDFMAAITSPEGQSANSLHEALQRKTFWNGETMLESLHTRGHLKKVPVDAVIMQPTPQKQIPLADILEQMERIAEGADRPEEVAGEMPGERIDEQVALNSDMDNKSIAQNLLQQAILLENEAEKKRAEAVRYDPTLAQKAAEAPKRGRGRPKGTTKEAIAAKTTSAEM
tara:strand:- start:3257 stop:3895 length:639 start_codon:yes stop_codon:yes gene_type:complete